MVKIEDPPPLRQTKPVVLDLPEGSKLLRIYCPEPYGTSPCSFRSQGGARGRFDHHLPEPDNTRAVHYSAETLAGCIVECFDPNAGVVLKGRRLGFLRTLRSLKLIDLRGSGAMKAGSVAALCKTEKRETTQKWSRYLYENHPEIEGLVYGNAHNDDTAYVLFERAEDALSCELDLKLEAAELRPWINKACADNNLVLMG